MLAGVTVTVGVAGRETAIGITHSDTGMLKEGPPPERVTVPVYTPTASPLGLTETLRLAGAVPFVADRTSHGALAVAVQDKLEPVALAKEMT